MERPTSDLHLARVTLSLRQLGAEPHTKEVGRDAVYNHHCLRSARGHDSGGGVTPRAPDAGAPYAAVRQSDHSALRRSTAPPGTDRLLLRSGTLRLRVAASAAVS